MKVVEGLVIHELAAAVLTALQCLHVVLQVAYLAVFGRFQKGLFLFLCASGESVQRQSRVVARTYFMLNLGL